MKGLHLVTNTRYGPMFYNKNDTIIGKSLEIYGEWSQMEIDFITQYIKPGDICVDAGAYIGTHTLAFLDKVGPDGSVLSFELQLFPFQLLCANIATKNHSAAWAFPFTLSNKSEITGVPFSNQHISGNHCNVSLKKISKDDSIFPSTSVNLDSFCFKKLDFLKIDVEGFEFEVLEGALNTIRSYKPLIFTEYHQGIHTQSIIPLLQSLGYRIYIHTAPSFNPSNFKKETNNIFGNYIEKNIFCVPEERDLKVDLPQLS